MGLKIKSTLCLLLFLFTIQFVNAQQKIVQLYNAAAPGSENWTWSEQENNNNAWWQDHGLP